MSCRILYLISQLSVGGQERQLFNILEAIDKLRFKPAVVVWNYNEDDFYVSKIRKLGIPLHPLPVRSSPVTKLATLCQLIRELQAEVVHSYSFYTNFIAWGATRNAEAVPVGSVRSSFFGGRAAVGWLIGALSGRWPRHQICNSHLAAAEVRNASSFFLPKALYVVVNGVNLQHFYSRPIADGDSASILAIGSLLPGKRWDLLLSAAKELQSSGLEFQLKIAGAGPSRAALSNQIHQLGLDGQVLLLGQRDDIANLLTEAAFVVHTSDMEGCPNVLIEAMSSGRAVIATDAGDIPLLVDCDVTGFVVRRGDQKALVSRMAELIANRKLCENMGKAARAKAEREFTITRLVEETLAAYRAAGWSDS